MNSRQITVTTIVDGKRVHKPMTVEGKSNPAVTKAVEAIAAESQYVQVHGSDNPHDMYMDTWLMPVGEGKVKPFYGGMGYYRMREEMVEAGRWVGAEA